MTQLQAIVAYAANRVIGRNNQLPWRLPEDLAHFKRTTLGHPILMGRRTWESIGRPLPGRHNIVVSRQPGLVLPGATVVSSLGEARSACAPSPVAYVIGGAELYAAALPYCSAVIATELHCEVAGDAWFAALDPAVWQVVERSEARACAPNDFSYAFVRYERLAHAQPL